MSDTLHNRSIHIEMWCKLPEEKSRRLPAKYYEQRIAIRMCCLRWAEDNAPKLRNTSIQAPVCHNDRAQDNWTQLFAMAAIAEENHQLFGKKQIISLLAFYHSFVLLSFLGDRSTS
jgi:hypothetical protein